jgi:AcrR family transcriptional regulator
MTDRRGLSSHSKDDGQDSGRERVSRAAYELFSREGVRAVGVDAVTARAGTAKMTLYRNFPSKDDLILDFLRRREQLWTRDWLEAESQRRGATPRARLLAIFDVFAEWFGQPDFEGCAFLTTMIEVSDREHPVYQAAVGHLANIRSYIESLAAECGIQDVDSFARKWHILMKGSIMAAHEGDTVAAARAREMGELLLKEQGCLTPPQGGAARGTRRARQSPWMVGPATAGPTIHGERKVTSAARITSILSNSRETRVRACS